MLNLALTFDSGSQKRKGATPVQQRYNGSTTILQSNIKDNQPTKGVLRKKLDGFVMVCIRWGFTRALQELLGAGVSD